MREFTCANCGAKGIDESHAQNKRFCCKECCDEYWQKMRRSGREYEHCKYNEGVQCSERKCGNCGWNPKVAKKRSEEFL